MTGRPTALTPKIRDVILAYLKAGNYLETAAAAAGITKQTLHAWLRRGRAESARLDNPKAKANAAEALYLDFLLAAEEAMATAEAQDLAMIGAAATTQWQAAAWRLERKYPGKWGRRVGHEISGKGGKPIAIAHSVGTMSEADLLAVASGKAPPKA